MIEVEAYFKKLHKMPWQGDCLSLGFPECAALIEDFCGEKFLNVDSFILLPYLFCSSTIRLILPLHCEIQNILKKS